MNFQKSKAHLTRALPCALLCALLGTLICVGQAQQPKLAAPISLEPLIWRPLGEPGSGGAMTDLAVSPRDSKRLLLAGDMLGVGLSLDGGDSWLPTYGFKSYEIARFSWHPHDPNTVWVGTMSGPYLSHDGGLNWSEKREGMGAKNWGGYSAPVEKVLFDPNDSNHLIATGGSSRNWRMDVKDGNNWGRIWDSRDAGEHWMRLTTIETDGTTTDDEKVIGDNILWADFAGQSSTKLYAIGYENGFMISTDGGKSWKTSNRGLPPMNSETGGIWGSVLHRATANPANSDVLWVGVNNYVPPGQTERVPGGVYKSVDGGQNWIESSKGLGHFASQDPNLASRYKAIAVAPSDPNVLYADDMSWATGVIYKSTDGGAHWTPLASRKNGGKDDDAARARLFQVESAMPSGLGMVGLEVDPNNADAVYGFATAYVSRTRDGGQTWDDATSFKLAGKEGWRGRGYAGWVATNFRFNPYKAGESMLQAMDSARAWRSGNDLQTWTASWENPAPYGGGYDATWARDGRVYATSGQGDFGGIGRSLDGGKTFETLQGAQFGLPARGAADRAYGIYVAPDDSMKVWATIGGKLYASANGGDSWKVALNKPGLEWIGADPKTPNRFYISGDDGVYATDNGRDFAFTGGPKISGRVAVDGVGRVYVASFKAVANRNAGLWRYDPTDKTWIRLREDNMIAGVAVDPRDPNRVAIGTSDQPFHDETRATGVWLSDDAGATWHQEIKGLSMLRGAVIAFDPFDSTRLIYGSEGRGFWMTRWPLPGK